MANRSLGGFRWKGNRYSPSSKAPPIEVIPVASAYGTELNLGDPVKRTTDGTIVAASPGDAVYGVFDGAERYWDGTVVRSGPTLPASTTYGSVLERQSLARVIPAKGQWFEVDADDGTTATTQAAHQALCGENAEWATGTAVNGRSGAVMDISTHNTTNTLSLRLEHLAKYPDIDFASSRVKYIVEFNLIQAPGVGTATGLA